MTNGMPANRNVLFYQQALDLPTVARAKGVWIEDTDGKRYLDGCSGAVVCSIGHGDERILRAMADQASRVAFAYRTQFESQPAVELAHALVGRLSQGLARVFYVSGGSEAVEAAIKLARQYHLANGEPGRHRVISRFPSYHGSTLGALAATGYTPLNEPFIPMTSEPLYIPAPACHRCPLGLERSTCALACASELERVIEAYGPETISAFLVEPVGGASTGALVPPDGYLAAVTKICRRHGVLTIYDEVMTGVGRTGAFCAYQHWEAPANGEVPVGGGGPEPYVPVGAEVDILALSKGLGAGYFPLGAVVCRTEVADVVLRGGGFAHGHTYAGNPLACAVGHAVLRVIEEDGLIANAAARGNDLLGGMRAIQQGARIVGHVRGIGLLTAMEFVADPTTFEPFDADLGVYQRITELARANGLLVYPRRSVGGTRGDHVLLAPPLTITAAEVQELLDRFGDAVTRLERQLLA
ncbi:MAG: aspartate aminotransferase family protein [Trueperaceae bacterium]